MKKSDPAFDRALRKATDWLMKEFIAWNNTQKKLREKGQPSNVYSKKEVAQEREVFRAIAERFLVEDVPYHEWQWLETPWVGDDGNTGMEALIVDFASKNYEMGVLGFYVTRNRRSWFVTPLAELSENGLVEIFEVNTIQQALDALRLKWLEG